MARDDRQRCLPARSPPVHSASVVPPTDDRSPSYGVRNAVQSHSCRQVAGRSVLGTTENQMSLSTSAVSAAKPTSAEMHYTPNRAECPSKCNIRRYCAKDPARDPSSMCRRTRGRQARFDPGHGQRRCAATGSAQYRAPPASGNRVRPRPRRGERVMDSNLRPSLGGSGGVLPLNYTCRDGAKPRGASPVQRRDWRGRADRPVGPLLTPCGAGTTTAVGTANSD